VLADTGSERQSPEPEVGRIFYETVGDCINHSLKGSLGPEES